MRQWTQIDGCDERNAFCFGYDPDWRGIVGQTPAFGSELFNDHHFHYGYFLYAAGVLAAHDPSVIDDLRPVMTLLAADIAGSADTGITPQWRPYDAYASHSWAAGTSEFADGNNQESSSEAVTAWAGLQLWAQAAGTLPWNVRPPGCSARKPTLRRRTGPTSTPLTPSTTASSTG